MVSDSLLLDQDKAQIEALRQQVKELRALNKRLEFSNFEYMSLVGELQSRLDEMQYVQGGIPFRTAQRLDRLLRKMPVIHQGIRQGLVILKRICSACRKKLAPGPSP